MTQAAEMPNPKVILTGFADEGPESKRAEEQFTMMRSLGLSYYTIRFIDVGRGVKNVLDLTDGELDRLHALQTSYGISVSSIGSPIGKVKLLDRDDGTSRRYVAFEDYLNVDLQRAIDLAAALDTKLVRGFSFYPPQGDDPWAHLDEAAERLVQIVERCAGSGLTYGLEVELDLVGRDGDTLIALYEKVGSPNICLIPDIGNLAAMGHSPDSAYRHYLKMKPGIGWIHVKGATGAARPGRVRTRHLPVDVEDSAHEPVLRDFRSLVPEIEERLSAFGVPGVFVDLEPHVRGGGPFGGVSGVDGFGVAFRALCRLLDHLAFDYHLTHYGDLHLDEGCPIR